VRDLGLGVGNVRSGVRVLGCREDLRPEVQVLPSGI